MFMAADIVVKGVMTGLAFCFRRHLDGASGQAFAELGAAQRSGYRRCVALWPPAALKMANRRSAATAGSSPA